MAQLTESNRNSRGKFEYFEGRELPDAPPFMPGDRVMYGKNCPEYGTVYRVYQPSGASFWRVEVTLDVRMQAKAPWDIAPTSDKLTAV